MMSCQTRAAKTTYERNSPAKHRVKLLVKNSVAGIDSCELQDLTPSSITLQTDAANPSNMQIIHLPICLLPISVQ